MRRAFVDVSYGFPFPDVAQVRTRAHGPLRGARLFLASIRADAIGVIRTGDGWRSVLLLRALLGRRRKLVAFQFLVHPGQGRLWDRIDRWAVRRALLVGPVCTRSEQADYAARYGLPAERFPFVPWPWRIARTAELLPAPATPLVLSTGRAFCDWPTLFEAARGRGWPLTVVCSREDRPTVGALNADGTATVLSEVPAHEHQELMKRATVLVAAMRDVGVAQGHNRLMDAADAGVPVVTSDVCGIRDYSVDGETALRVPPGDAPALRDAVERMLDEPETRERVRRAAFERSQQWTAEEYLGALRDLLLGYGDQA
jgi:glycosyltransferase involved in cell wall biosynthesis